jgi:glycosyltransferase domain-containing protein
MISILVPSINRQDYLLRLLRFYYEVHFEGEIIIGDASDNSLEAIYKAELTRLRLRLNVQYLHLKFASIQTAIRSMAEAARGKYCVFCGDDDLLLPSGLDACRAFLENNSDYKTVQGDSCLFVLRSSDGVVGRFAYAQHYWNQLSLEENSSFRRLQEFSNNYWVPQFSLHRTEDFVRVQKMVSRFSDNHFFELISNAIFIASGKSKFLPTPYLLRQAHDRRIHHFSLHDWQAQPVFKESYDEFIGLLALVLKGEAPADITEARQAAVEFFKTYLSSAQSRPLKPPRKSVETQRIYVWFKRLLGRYLGTYSERHMLESLIHYLSPKSPIEARTLFELRTFVKILHGASGPCIV